VKVGLVGFGGSGKSTVFAALTGMLSPGGKGALGQIRVPDPRVDELARLCRPRKTTYAEITFEDYPPGSFGSGESSIAPAVLGQMRTLDVLAEVVDAFSGEGLPGAARRINDFHAELLLSDLAVIEKRIERLTRERGQPGEKELLERCRAALETDMELKACALAAHELAMVAGFRLLTLKPRMVLVNTAESEMASTPGVVHDTAAKHGLEPLLMCAPLEYELTQLAPDDRAAFLQDLGLSARACDRFIASCYSLLDLITFLTAGEDEVRAWPIRRGAKAVEAAGKIHSDIARGFIRAEVISFADYVAAGGEAGCRQSGKLRMEGKDYCMQDGDVVHYRFNV
jgi:hypothetical protein